MKIKEIDNYSGFIALEDEWRNLLARCDHTVFSTWEYLSTWWKHLGEGAKLRIMIAEEDGKLLGIAPFMLSKHTFGGFGSLNKIQFIGQGSTNYACFILRKEHPECLELFLNNLLHFSDWDLLELEEISEETTSAKLLNSIKNCRIPELILDECSSCPYISLPASLNDFLKNFSRNKKKNLNRRMRKLQKKYTVEFKTQNDFGSIKEAMEIFFGLHQKRWKSKGCEGVFHGKKNRDFHINLADILNKKNWLALHFLTLDDQPVAAAYSFDYNLKKYGYLTGFDPNFSQFGVGNLLKIHLIEECITKQFLEYDLGRGLGFGKDVWATGVRKNIAVRITNKGWHAPLVLWISKIAAYPRYWVHKKH